MPAERAMSNSSAPVKAVKSDEIKECFVLVNSINTPIGKPMILPHSKIRCKCCVHTLTTWTLQKLKVHVAGQKIRDMKVSPCAVDKVNLELRSRLLQEINEAEDQERTRKRAKLDTEKGAAAITDHFKADTSKETAADLAILDSQAGSEAVVRLPQSTL